MNPGRWLWSSCLLLALAAPAAAQGGKGKFALKASFDPAAGKPGDAVTLVLEATVADGWHAYGTLERTNIPVALKAAKLKLGGLELAGDAVVPPGERHATAIGDQFPLPNEFVVRQPLKVPAGASAGEITVSGALDYQICDENSCLPPAAMPFSAKFVVQAGGGAPAAQPAAAGQDPPPVPGTKPGLQLAPDENFAVRARFDPATARAGETVRLVLAAKVADEYHAYGTLETTNVPVALDATKLKLGGLEAAGAAEVPAGERFDKHGTAEYRLPHEFEVVQRIVVPAGTRPGPIAVDGALDYTICDENSCLPEAEARFRAVLQIEAGEARAEFVAKPVDPPKNGGAEAKVREPKYTLDDVADANALTGSWWTLILLSIAGGLFALVMPCTYPMIPITFSFFTKQADRLHGKVLPLALTYGIGIVLMFVLIGVAVGDPIIRFAGHWATNLVIGVAFVVFAASLFGLFTLQLPAFVTNAAGRASSSGGLLGVFLMGATLVVSSFTCTAPIVGALLAGIAPRVDGASPDAAAYVRVGLGMAVFGLTMAAPFVFLALLPGRVKALPKSGEWMNTLKVSLGFVELAAALKFFSNVELTLGWGVLPREAFLMVWAFLFVALALFLFGLLGYRGAPVAGVSATRNGFGLLSLAFAFYCLFGTMGFTLDPIMTAFEPPYRIRPIDEHTIVKDDHEAAVELAARDGKYVLVNFTGFT